jgi:hypothetical protein
LWKKEGRKNEGRAGERGSGEKNFHISNLKFEELFSRSPAAHLPKIKLRCGKFEK